MAKNTFKQLGNAIEAREEAQRDTVLRELEEAETERERLVLRHRGREAALLENLSKKGGELLALEDSLLWGVDWRFAPQSFRFTLTSLRGIRNKIRTGFFVLLVRVVDRVGGRLIRFRGEDFGTRGECAAATKPFLYHAKTNRVDLFIGDSLELLCPAPGKINNTACLRLELWQLCSGKHDPVDRVVGFGYWPFLNAMRRVQPGRCRLPLLMGRLDKSRASYGPDSTMLEGHNLNKWLCNAYFEVERLGPVDETHYRLPAHRPPGLVVIAEEVDNPLGPVEDGLLASMRERSVGEYSRSGSMDGKGQDNDSTTTANTKSKKLSTELISTRSAGQLSTDSRPPCFPRLPPSHFFPLKGQTRPSDSTTDDLIPKQNPLDDSYALLNDDDENSSRVLKESSSSFWEQRQHYIQGDYMSGNGLLLGEFGDLDRAAAMSDPDTAPTRTTIDQAGIVLDYRSLNKVEQAIRHELASAGSVRLNREARNPGLFSTSLLNSFGVLELSSNPLDPSELGGNGHPLNSFSSLAMDRRAFSGFDASLGASNLQVHTLAKDDSDTPQDSHVLLQQHHFSVSSVRDVYFSGRRWSPLLNALKSTLLSDAGVSHPFSLLSMIRFFLSILVALYARVYIHALGSYLILLLLHVAIIRNDWEPYGVVHIRFDPSGLSLELSEMTLMAAAGPVMCFVCFLLASTACYGILRVFGSIPHVLTRFVLWFGVISCLDPLLSFLTDMIFGNTVSGDAFLLTASIKAVSQEDSIQGVALTLLTYLLIELPQPFALLLFATCVYLNGRVRCLYARLTHPERSFHLPHDLELSHKRFQQLLESTQTWQNERGEIRTIRTDTLRIPKSSLLRQRLFKLLSIPSASANNGTEAWIAEYFRDAPLCATTSSGFEPSRDTFKESQNVGSFRLAKDIVRFLKVHFPHLCDTPYLVAGDLNTDAYYESELLDSIHQYAPTLEDEAELRQLLRLYFTSYVTGDKPVIWASDLSQDTAATMGLGNDDNDADRHFSIGSWNASPLELSEDQEDGWSTQSESAVDHNQHQDDPHRPMVAEGFVIRNAQLLADLLFFETHGASRRLVSLYHFLRRGVLNAPRSQLLRVNPSQPMSWIHATLPRFHQHRPIESCTRGSMEGTVVHIVQEMPLRQTKKLLRSFTIMPNASILEAVPGSFTLTKHHTSYDPEFWLQKTWEHGQGIFEC